METAQLQAHHSQRERENRNLYITGFAQNQLYCIGHEWLMWQLALENSTATVLQSTGGDVWRWFKSLVCFMQGHCSLERRHVNTGSLAWWRLWREGQESSTGQVAKIRPFAGFFSFFQCIGPVRCLLTSHSLEYINKSPGKPGLTFYLNPQPAWCSG